MRFRRLSFQGAVHHVSMRCNNREFLFDDDADRRMFVSVLGRMKQRHGFELYDYCLLTNHFHMLLRSGPIALPDLMHDLASTYARLFNARHGRVGHLWEKRYLSPLVEPDALVLELMSYIDLNMWRARGVKQPDDWPWCGYRHWVLGEPNPLLDAPAQYGRLGGRPSVRRRAYAQFLAGMQWEPARFGRMWQAAVLGRREFVLRMERRFRKELTSGPVYTIQELEPGIWGIVLGGKMRGWHEPEQPQAAG
jgi:putative transposase